MNSPIRFVFFLVFLIALAWVFYTFGPKFGRRVDENTDTNVEQVDVPPTELPSDENQAAEEGTARPRKAAKSASSKNDAELDGRFKPVKVVPVRNASGELQKSDQLDDPNDSKFLDRVEETLYDPARDGRKDPNLVEQYEKVIFRKGKVSLNMQTLHDSGKFRSLNPWLHTREIMKAKELDPEKVTLPEKLHLNVLVVASCNWRDNSEVQKFATSKDKERLAQGLALRMRIELDKAYTIESFVDKVASESCFHEVSN